jgi:type I restriction enzyme S subunit
LNWTQTRLKFLASIPITNGVGEPASYSDPAWPRYIRTTDIAGPHALRDDTFASLPFETASAAMLKRDDILMTAAGSIGKSFRFDSDDNACYAGYLVRFRAKDGVDPRFVSYWAESVQYWDQVHSGRVTSTIDNFSAGRYQNLRIAVPGLPDQKAIVGFLDGETARIEKLAAAHRQVANLALERARVLIRMRISGPWPHLPMKRAWLVVDCKHRTPPYVSAGYPVVSPGDIRPGRLSLAGCTRFVDRADFDDLTQGRRPMRGDIVYSRNASIGTAALVAVDDEFCMGQDVCLIKSRNQDLRFLMYALNTVGLDQVEEAKIGSTFNRINVARVLNILIPTPSEVDQKRIADELDRISMQTDELVVKIERQIELLAERRQALITAAVTGQIPIPGVAA